MRKIDSRWDYFVQIGGLLLITLSLKLFVNLELGLYFSIMIETIKDSGKNFIFIVFIIGFISQLPFVIFSYYAFGYNVEDYNSITSSFITQITSCFAFIDFIGIYSTNPFLSIILLLRFTILIYFLFFNLLISIMERSLSKVKEKFEGFNKNYSFIRIFCFCFFKKNNKDIKNNDEIEKEFDFSKKVEVKLS